MKTMHRALGTICATALAIPFLLLLALFASGPWGAAPLAAQGRLDGKAIFLAQKCNLCHGVESAGIARTTKSEKVAGPDLTGVGARHDEAFLAKYLTKQEAIDGKQHGKQWKDGEEELQALIHWLAAQKK